MSMAVNFRGGETTGSVADRPVETAKKETTGGVGARKQQESIFAVDNEPKCDTVCFKGREYNGVEKKNSAGEVILGTTGLLLIAGGLLGLAYKYGTLNNIKNANKITEPCYKACKWVKNNFYDKVTSYFKSK